MSQSRNDPSNQNEITVASKENLVEFVINTHNGKKLSVFVPVSSIIVGHRVLADTQNFLPLRVFSTNFICCFTAVMDVMVDILQTQNNRFRVKITVYHTEAGSRVLWARHETSVEHCLRSAGQPSQHQPKSQVSGTTQPPAHETRTSLGTHAAETYEKS